MESFDINHPCFKRVVIVTDFASVANPAQIEKWVVNEGSLARMTRSLLKGRLDKKTFMERLRKFMPNAPETYIDTFKADPEKLGWTANTLTDDHALNTDGCLAVALDACNTPMYWMTGTVQQDIFYFKGLSRSLIYEWTQASRDLPYKTPRCSMPLVSYLVWYLKDHNPQLRTIYVQPSQGTITILEALSPGTQVVPLPKETELDDGSVFTHSFEINDAVTGYWRLDADQQKRQKCIECGAIGSNLILQVGTWDRTFCDKSCLSAACARSPHIKG